MTKKLFCTTYFLLFAILVSSASSPRILHRKLSWKPAVETKLSEKEKIKSLYFDGAGYNEKNIPVFIETISLEGNFNSVKAEIENALYEPLQKDEVALLEKNIKNEVEIKAEVGYRKKVPLAFISIVPFRLNNFTHRIEKLVSFDLKVTPGNSSRVNTNSAVHSYARNSVLASGNWYKIAVVQQGVYKITYQLLKNMGVDVDHIDPRNIRLYGNGGGMLSVANSDSRLDDLQENSIYVDGESDGVFNSADFILFYGKDQTRWTYKSTSLAFNHQKNLYADSSYYFFTTDLGTGKRIQSRPSSSQTPNQNITTGNFYIYHEADLVNMLKSGKNWYGEAVDVLNSVINASSSAHNISAADSVKISAAVIGRSIHAGNTFTLSVNGQLIDTKSIANTCESVTCDYAFASVLSGAFIPASSDFNTQINFSSADASATGYLDYIEINGKAHLDFSGVGNQFQFRDVKSVGTGNVGEYKISNASNSLTVWDVTDILNVAQQQTNFNSGQLSFVCPADVLHEYIVFNNTGFLTPVFSGKADNQNLHGLSQVQMVIVTNPLFLSQANALAGFHRTNDNLSVCVVTTPQVFNEFASGAQDVSSIRDFMKMFYDRATTAAEIPKYLLLFGDASYDNKDRIPGNTNFVTSYQSDASLNLTQSYISDDFFGLLDNSEGIWSSSSNSEALDISVGRLPAKNTAEANGLLNKIITYSTADPSSVAEATCCDNNPTVFGDWRNSVTFVGDDQDVNTHFHQSESLANYVSQTYPVYNIDKIYLDAYKQEVTPGGQRIPDAHDAIVKRIQRGTLLMSYVGHGGEVGWAVEGVLNVSDINSWTNIHNLPAFLTATCEFSRVDDPARTSAGEMVVLNPNGGGICLFSTTRLAFSSSNFSLASKFFKHLFEPINGLMPTCGEVFEQTKIDYTDRYTRNFLLLGDPAMRLAYPNFDVKTNTINAVSVSSTADTLRALSRVTITGEVVDKSGVKLTNFNGIVSPTVYDKMVTYYTLGNDSDNADADYPEPFDLQKNILYKGKASVKNGNFTFTFVVPKDISYVYGFGKLSYYAQNGNSDANGYYKNIVIGGINQNAGSDAKGPDIKLFLHDEKFVFGGMTDPNPTLYAVVTDTSGINTVGNGIGHDVTVELDDDNSKLYVLNDYYEADLNNYQAGKVRYQFNSLSEGRHSVKFKVWDVYNNSGEATTEFVVSQSASLALDHVFNYPNPFTTHTSFMFEHNRPCSQLSVQIQIFTVSGKLVKSIDRLITTTGFRSNEIEWDGLDEYGEKIGRGVYIYKLRIKSTDQSYADKFEKLVILR